MCSPGFAGDGGPAIDARLAQHSGAGALPGGRLIYDSQGNLFIADTHNHRIRKVDTDGIITTIAGTGATGYLGDGGPATEARLDSPIDIALAGDGTLYVTDTANSCVRRA